MLFSYVMLDVRNEQSIGMLKCLCTGTKSFIVNGLGS